VGPELLSAREVARTLRVRQETVLAWLHSGQLPAIRRGSRWYVLAADVDQFIRDRAREEAAERRDAASV